MKRQLQAASVFLALALATGCVPPAQTRASALASWMNAQSYSTWSTFKHEGQHPQHPPSPDGLTLGSPNIFAAIGCHPDDLTSLDVFWADRRTARPLAKPLRLAVQTKSRSELVLLAQFPDQTLRRVRHTAIAVSQSEGQGLRITCLDFAPMGENDNFLVRWFLLENTGRASLRPTLVLRMMAPGDWSRLGPHTWQRGDRLAIISDARLRCQENEVQLSMGRLAPGSRAAGALLLVAVAQPDDLPKHIARAERSLPRLMDLLDETKADWERWCARTPLQTRDQRTDDLLDSLLCLLRTHIGPQAIHTGSLRYPHNRAWIRDNYWVQRALLELGRIEEARLNLDFFHRAWRTSGLASSYQIPTGRGFSFGFPAVELPHYLVLMVRDAEHFAGVHALDYWDMVRDCLDQAAVPPSGLQPMNGDETWLLAAPVRELDDLLDNSWLLIASAEYAADLAARASDQARALRYRHLASRARAALQQFTPNGQQPSWYAIGRGGDGSLDFSLCPEVFARGAILGVLPATLLTEGLLSSWERLSFERGIRTHSRSATISGGTPGYVLYAAADSDICDSLFNRDLARRMLEFASATGCVWEYHDLHDPTWGGEKRRLWDSAVLLMGMVHALFNIERHDGTITFTPKGPPVAVLYERPCSDRVGREEAEQLLAAAGPALILHQGSPEHAARIARELLRQRSRQYAVATFSGNPPAKQSAIIISPTRPSAGWRAEYSGYWVREWDGPPQLWIVNKGDVYRDTEPLLRALLPDLTPQRQEPLPYPRANYHLAARFGETPTGQADLVMSSGAASARDLVILSPPAGGRRIHSNHLNLSGGNVSLNSHGTQVTVKAAPDNQRRLLNLTVSTAPRQAQVPLAITFPPGWWVVYARDMTGEWDRVRDPVHQVNLPDGRLHLLYSFSPGPDPVYITLNLARLARLPGGGPAVAQR